MTTAQALLEARAMRRLAAEVGEDLADMARTLVRIGERSDWQDARVALIETEITRWTHFRLRLIAQARHLEAGAAA